MNNTKKRVLSAAVLVSMVLFCMYMGPDWLTGLTLLIGCIIVDEIYVNFLKKKKRDLIYGIVQFIYFIGFIALTFFNVSETVFKSAIALGLILNICLTIFLFRYQGSPEKRFLRFLDTQVWWVSVYVLIITLCLSYPLYTINWLKWLFLILILNFSADTFAWFFGRKFGKKKLMPSVSPNKTVEGAIGGILSSVFISSLFWIFFIDNLTLYVILALGLIAVFSVLGDLVQSKVKRLFEIKDSSSLIPGHGGVFDRLDSLLFVMPFYVTLIINKG